MGTRVLSQESGSQGIKLTIHLHLVPRLRMSRAITLLPLYAIMLWKGIMLPFFLIFTQLLPPTLPGISCNYLLKF